MLDEGDSLTHDDKVLLKLILCRTVVDHDKLGHREPIQVDWPLKQWEVESTVVRWLVGIFRIRRRRRYHWDQCCHGWTKRWPLFLDAIKSSAWDLGQENTREELCTEVLVLDDLESLL